MSKPLSEQDFTDIYLKILRDFSFLRAAHGELEAENTQLRAQKEALRAGQGRWPEHDDSPAGEQVPRVISAEELRYGVKIATFADDGHPVAGVVGGHASYGFSLLMHGDKVQEFSTGRTIVLLADAPVRIDIPSEQVRFKGMTDLRYKGSDPATRLTVHALNTAPVGSTIYGRNLRKGPDERWWCGPYNYSAEDLIANGWADGALHHPERGDDE